jgi:ribose transport system substrate-binding protein
MRGALSGPGRLAAAAVTVGLTLSACGSADTNSSATGAESAAKTTPADSGVVAQAKAQVAKFTAAQPAIKVPALSKQPPKGITMGLMGCPLPVCKIETDGATAGAKALGWNVKTYTTPLTPEGYLQTWKQILSDKPDAIAYLGLLPQGAIKAQLAAATKAHIPTVVYAANGGVVTGSGAPQASYTDDPVFKTDGDLMGAAVVADGGTGVKAVVVNDPTFSYWTTTSNAFKAGVEQAGGSVSDLKVAAAGIGKTIPGAIVSYLERHPDTRYVALAVNDFSVGLAPALKSAGLAGKVKVISRAPSAANMADIASGAQWASVADENTAAGWRITDGLARLLVGDALSPCCVKPDGWHQIITKDNAVASSAPKTPGVPDAFLSSWGV